MNEVEIFSPEFPESVSNAQIIHWRKKVGDYVRQGDVLVDIETDKIILEVPASAEGILINIMLVDGSIVDSKQRIGIIRKQKENSLAETTLDYKKNRNLKSNFEASPSIRKLVNEHGIDHTLIQATGKKGKIVRDDILKKIKKNNIINKIDRQYKCNDSNITNKNVFNERKIRRERMSPLRKKISERLLLSQSTMVTSTTFNEVNMKSILCLRNEYKNKFQEKHKIKLGMTSFFVKAIAESLKKFPEVNSSIHEEDIIYYKYVDISIAVATSRGLVTPVLRNVESMSILNIEKKIKDFSRRGNEGKLSIEDLTGGNFTISNGGTFGSLMSIPIINPPQTAILGMHAITDRVIVVEKKMKVFPMMYLSLSYDHRIIDGKTSIQFLLRVKEILEDFSRILLDI